MEEAITTVGLREVTGTLGVAREDLGVVGEGIGGIPSQRLDTVSFRRTDV